MIDAGEYDAAETYVHKMLAYIEDVDAENHPVQIMVCTAYALLYDIATHHGDEHSQHHFMKLGSALAKKLENKPLLAIFEKRKS